MMEFPRIYPPHWEIVDHPHFELCARSVGGLSVLGDITEKPDGRKWKHVSFSRVDRIPSFEEIKEVKEVFFGPGEWAIQVFPEAKNYVNIHPHCLHLWGCADSILPDFTWGLGTI